MFSSDYKTRLDHSYPTQTDLDLAVHTINFSHCARKSEINWLETFPNDHEKNSNPGNNNKSEKLLYRDLYSHNLKNPAYMERG